MKNINMLIRNQVSVKFFHRCKSVIQTSYEVVKANVGELKLETMEGEGCSITILLNDIL